MTEKLLKKIPTIKSENGILYGGFTTLSENEKRKIKGGANLKCVNSFDCTKGTHTGCSNTRTCFSDGTEATE